MRGKNIDNEFVMSFIQECAVKGKDTPEDICMYALEQIKEIDKHLKLRMKLSDVLSFFGYKKKDSLTSEKEQFTFNDINYDLALIIFNNVYGGNIDEFFKFASKTNDLKYEQDLIFTLKAMLATKVLSRNSSDIIEDGEKIKEYYESLS